MGGKKWIAISSGPSLIPKSVLTLYGATERESNWVWWIPYTLGISVSLYSTPSQKIAEDSQRHVRASISRPLGPGRHFQVGNLLA